MRVNPIRTPEMIAQRSAQKHASAQAELDKLLRQFSRAHHAGIIERLRPHLAFDPQPLFRDPQ